MGDGRVTQDEYLVLESMGGDVLALTAHELFHGDIAIYLNPDGVEQLAEQINRFRVGMPVTSVIKGIGGSRG